MAKLVDALDLGSSVLRCAGSSPVRRTLVTKGNFHTDFPLCRFYTKQYQMNLGSADKKILSSYIISFRRIHVDFFFMRIIEMSVLSYPGGCFKSK